MVSRYEQLLEALLNGETADIVPQSRNEELLLALINGEKPTGTPMSRTEALLHALCERGMSGGATIKNQNKTITENGTYTADPGYTGLGTVTVNVESEAGGGEWTSDGLADQSQPTGTINLTIKKVGNYAFYGCKNIEVVNAPNLTDVNAYSFNGCTGLHTLNAPLLYYVAQNGLDSTLIETLEMPNAVAEPFGYSGLNNMKALKRVDIGQTGARIQGMAFNKCAALSTLILRNPSGVSLINANAFNNTPFASGGAGGTIYIPKALLDSGWYTTATNWSVVNGYGTITWKAIEGSEYE